MSYFVLPIKFGCLLLNYKLMLINYLGWGKRELIFLVSNSRKSKRKEMNRNWCNQKANPALKTKAGNK